MTEFIELLQVMIMFGGVIVVFSLVYLLPMILIYWLQLYIIKEAIAIFLKTQCNLPFSFKSNLFTKESIKITCFYVMLTGNAFVIVGCLLSPFYEKLCEIFKIDSYSYLLLYSMLKSFTKAFLLSWIIIVPFTILFEKLKEYSERLFIRIAGLTGLTGIISFISFTIYIFFINRSFFLENTTTFYITGIITCSASIMGLKILFSYLFPFLKKLLKKP